MPQIIIAYFATAIVFFAVDFIWIGVIARRFYRDQLGDLMADPIRINWAVAFYLIYVAGIVWFAVRPALDGGGWKMAVLNGVLFGFFCYATYDMTNMATLKGWPLKMSLVDMAWGTAMTGFAAFAGFYITRAVTP